VIQVLSTNGNTHLGGDDFDQRVMEFVLGEFRKETGIDLRKDPMALQRLKESCEKAKVELSSMAETDLNLPFISQGADRSPVHLTMKLTRAKLEQLIGDLLESTIEPCKAALADAKLKASDIDEAVLVGGSTRIPKIQQLVKDFFGREPNRSVNPDEVVAIGAAIQAAVLGGEMRDILLLDVTPLTLGIKVEGGIVAPLIPRNTTIPVQRSQTFSTAADNQPGVTVEVYQGERPMAEDNRKLGNFDLQGIPPSPRGLPQIEVTFDLDASGILNVKARDKGTGQEQQIRVTASTGLDEGQIQTMVREAEQFSDRDKARKDLAEARNLADHTIYSTEKTLRDYGEKLTPADREKIQPEIERLRQAKEGDRADEIRREIEALNRIVHEFSKTLYEAASSSAGAAPQGPGAPPDGGSPNAGPGENVVDAEFRKKSDDRKAG
jgi:molecular chaperone DnaK